MQVFVGCSIVVGVVLAVVSHGGLLLATNHITPGNLMSFLVATQTIQRSEFIVSLSIVLQFQPPPPPSVCLCLYDFSTLCSVMM